MVLHVAANKRIFSSDGAMWSVWKLLYCTSAFVVRKFTNSLQHKMIEGKGRYRSFAPKNCRFWARRWSESSPIVSSLASSTGLALSCLSSRSVCSAISWRSSLKPTQKRNFPRIIPLMTSLGVRTLDQLCVTWGVTWLFSKVVNKPNGTATQVNKTSLDFNAGQGKYLCVTEDKRKGDGCSGAVFWKER